MDELGPLLRLRAEWRQVAAACIPAAGGEIADALDQGLDILEAHDQIDVESLTMLADVVMGDIVHARPDALGQLQQRLYGSIREYAHQVAAARAPDIEGAAFVDLETLADAFGQMALRRDDDVP